MDWLSGNEKLGHFSVDPILKPDLYAVTASKEYMDYWFIEVDLATESPAIVVRKCEQYIHYFQSGVEQRRSGVFPRVIWIVPTDKRKDSLTFYIQNRFQGWKQDVSIVIVLDELAGLVTDKSEGKTAIEKSGKNVKNTIKTGAKSLGAKS